MTAIHSASAKDFPSRECRHRIGKIRETGLSVVGLLAKQAEFDTA